MSKREEPQVEALVERLRGLATDERRADLERALADRTETAAPHLLGRAVLRGDRDVVDELVTGDPLRQRSALMATLALVRHGETADAVRLARAMTARAR